MKLVIAVIQDKKSEPLLKLLVESGFRATKLASTGGLLKKGSTTLFMGVEEEQADRAIAEIRKACKAAIFVLNVEKYVKV